MGRVLSITLCVVRAPIALCMGRSRREHQRGRDERRCRAGALRGWVALVPEATGGRREAGKPPAADLKAPQAPCSPHPLSKSVVRVPTTREELDHRFRR